MNQKYEYTMGGLPADVDPMSELANLQKMGEDGWELCAVYRKELNGQKILMHYYRRPKSVIVPPTAPHALILPHGK